MKRELAWVRTLAWAAGAAALATLAWWIGDEGRLTRTVIILAATIPVVIVAATSFVTPVVRYRHAGWKVDDEGLMIRGGAWWRNEVRVPRTRIQHTDVQQGPLQRRHGLGTLVVYTAGTHHGAVALDGVAYDTATMLRDLLGGGDVSQPV
jgi:membrane protein YdbS with pleckstrin-like domain